MARLLFEKQGIRTRAGPLATGTEFVVYTDSAGTVFADISATSGGSAIAGSTVTVADIAGLGPSALKFYGPPAGTDTLYLRCPADTSLGVQEIEADEDERLDALEAAGGAHPNLATHDSMGLATQTELDAQTDRIDIVVDEGLLWMDDPRVGGVLDGVTDDGAAYDVAKAMVKVAHASGAVGGGIGIPARRCLLTNRQLVLPNGGRLVGMGRKSSWVKAGGSFPTSTPMVRLGEGTGIVFGCRVEDLELRCESIAGSSGVYSTEAQEQSGVRNVVVSDFRAWGINWDTGTSIVTVEHCELYASASGASGGLRCAASGQNTVRDVTSNAVGTGVAGDGFLILSDCSLEGCHVESWVDGAEYSTLASGTVDSLYGHSTVTNLLHLAAGTSTVTARNLVANSATNTLVDDFHGVTLPSGPAPVVRLYTQGDIYLTGVRTGPTRSDVKRRSAGDITVNSTSWIDLENTLDILLVAAAGDRVEVSLGGLWSNEGVNGFLDVATVVAAAPVTYVSSGSGTPSTPGITAWVGFSGEFVFVGGSALLTLGSGDIESGTVRLRLRTKTATATNKLLKADTDWPLMFTAKNLGPG